MDTTDRTIVWIIVALAVVALVLYLFEVAPRNYNSPNTDAYTTTEQTSTSLLASPYYYNNNSYPYPSTTSTTTYDLTVPYASNYHYSYYYGAGYTRRAPENPQYYNYNY